MHAFFCFFFYFIFFENLIFKFLIFVFFYLNLIYLNPFSTSFFDHQASFKLIYNLISKSPNFFLIRYLSLSLFCHRSSNWFGEQSELLVQVDPTINIVGFLSLVIQIKKICKHETLSTQSQNKNLKINPV